MQTFATQFNPKRNSLNAIRLGLALVVITSHVWPLGGYGEDPGQGPDTSNLGAWAVAGFFGISGYLITSSRLNCSSLRDYMWRRALRIYPAFIVAILIIGLVVSPVGAQIDARNVWTPRAGLHFVVQALPLWLQTYAPAGSLMSTPRSEWVGTLWTLSHEFGCYLVVGIVVSLVRNRRLLIGMMGVWLTTATAATIAHEALGTSEFAEPVRFARLSAFFAAGALLYLLRDRIPVSRGLAVVSLGALVATVLTGTFSSFAGVPMAYLMIYLGTTLPWARIGATNDISYGLYIWGWPVEQLLVMIFGPGALPIPVFLVAAIAGTMPFAWASWWFIERRAMRWNRLFASESRSARSTRIEPLGGTVA